LKTQLLCTFAHKKDLDLIIDYIISSYIIYEKRLFVFHNDDNLDDLYITYNVEPLEYRKTSNTIMIHRKKETNTLYTVNALNAIIRDANNGLLDKSFQIDWKLYQNSLILSDESGVRHIHLAMLRRINVH
jgi:hypothetical protein